LENRGGRLISEALENLKLEIDEYYAKLNEIKNVSLKNPYAKIEIPDLPEALELYEMCTEMHIPLVDGGLLDQPNIWLLEYGICKKRKEIWKQLNINDNAPNQKQNMADDLDFKFAQDK
jgi:hypothetical protein